MQLMWVSGPTGRVKKISITLRTVSIAMAVFALVAVAIGMGIHFVGLRVAIEMRPEIARSMGGVLTAAQQEELEAGYRARFDEVNTRFQTTVDNLNQLTKLKDRLMDLATPNPLKTNTPSSSSGKGGPYLPIVKNVARTDNLYEVLDGSIQNVEQLNSNIKELTVLWSKQIAWLEALPTAYPVKHSHQVSSGYGLRVDPFTSQMARHGGIDFPGPVGAPILATAKGVVVRAEFDREYGNFIEIKHIDGFKTLYGHNSQLLVKVGQVVERGEQIAKLGNTGRSTGPHLHYEVIKAGSTMNPAAMLIKLSAN